MEKRIFLAVVISIALLVGWSVLIPKLFPELVRKPEPPKPATATATSAPPASTASAPPAAATAGTTATTSATATTPATAPAVAASAPIATPVSGERAQMTVVETPDFRAVFSNRGAQLVSFQLRKYERKKSKQPVDLVKERPRARSEYPFTIVPHQSTPDLHRLNRVLYAVSEREEKGERVIEYRYSDGRISVTKTFRFNPLEPFLFDFSVDIDPPVPYRIAIGPGISNVPRGEEDSTVLITGNAVVQAQGDFEILPREKVPTVKSVGSVDFVGIEDNYFMTALRPTQGADAVLQRVAFFDEKKHRRDDVYAGINANGEGAVAGQAFFGPKETKVLDAYGMSEALQFGWFGLIARFFLEALVWINQFTHNYGFAIIVLTILIKIALYPLQHKSIVSMKKMQRVQPKVEAIRAKYKKSKTDADQRQKMNVEMMQLYQKEGINPMAGCLPLILQLPILWGFYNLLSRAIELRGADFMLWIRDLSEKDPTYVLPILMTATMFIQTYITPATGDPMQRRMFLIMPLIFGFLFKDFPSGLVLYWLVQNILTIIQQLIMNKWWKEHPEELQK
jgi:YidC/Oxa1 family membrane protein insertase